MKTILYLILSLLAMFFIYATIYNFIAKPIPKINGEVKIVQDTNLNIVVTEWDCVTKNNGLLIEGKAVNKTGKTITNPLVEITVLRNDSAYHYNKPFILTEGVYKNNDTFYFEARSQYIVDFAKPAVLYFSFSQL